MINIYYISKIVFKSSQLRFINYCIFKSLSLLIFLIFLFLLNSSIYAVQKKKDILFIAIDDMNDWTTLYDDSNPIKTPNLKRLAERGVFLVGPIAVLQHAILREWLF